MESQATRLSERVLYVDAHLNSCEMMRPLLGFSGYKVTTANNVGEGQELATKGRFDLIIISDWFSDGTGVELCRKIRGFDQRTPIVFYSGLAGAADIRAGMSAGAQSYLVKPNIDSLEPTISRLLNRCALAASQR